MSDVSPSRKTTRSKKKSKRTPARPPDTVLGWREWAALPDLGVSAIKVKLDTGARTSSLHAFDLERVVRGGEPWVRFEIHPEQRSKQGAVQVEAAVVDERWVRNSGGDRELRPVIETTVRIGDRTWPIELTLTRRDEMGFRMLLGRQALRKRATVDPGGSFRAGRRKKKKGSTDTPAAKKKRKPSKKKRADARPEERS